MAIAGEYQQHQKDHRELAEDRDDGRVVAQMRCESGLFQAESEGDGIEQERFIEIGKPRELPYTMISS